MLTRGEDVEAHALRKRGWSISAIARHLDRDRKTIRAYLNDERVPGVRARSGPDPLARFEKYLTARFADDHHVWGTVLFEEVENARLLPELSDVRAPGRQTKGLRRTARRAQA